MIFFIYFLYHAIQAEFGCTVFAPPILIENETHTQKIIFDHTLPLSACILFLIYYASIRNALILQAHATCCEYEL